MKRGLLFITALLFFSLIHAQLPQKTGGNQGFEINVIKGTSYMIAPAAVDTPIVPVAMRVIYIGAFMQRRVAGDTAYFGWTGTRWIRIGGNGSMIFPAAGIPLSTGGAWAGSITNNSDQWNLAASWGNHQGLYKPVNWFPTWNEVLDKPALTASALDFLNVMEFGAISGDTSVDNSTVITRTIDSAHARGIKKVLIPLNVNLYVKQSFFIRHSNIELIINGKITARPGSTSQYSVRRGCVILAAPKIAYHGALNNRLSDITITGGGTIDLTQVPAPLSTDVLVSGSFNPAMPDDWGGGHAIEINSVTNAIVEKITITGSIMGTIGFGNIMNGTIRNNTLIGLRNVKMSQTYMLNGNMINVYSLDPEKKTGDSTYLGNISVENNYLDGLTPGEIYPFILDGVTPPGGANIGVNIATEPFNAPNAKITGVVVKGNKVRHCIWAINAEGQFEAGSNSGCIMNENTVEFCYNGIANITNSWDRNNAFSFIISNNVLKNIIGDAIQSYGGSAMITNNIIEDLGLGREDNAQIQQFFNGNYRFSTAVKMFPFNLSATSPFVGGNVVVSGLTVTNTVKNDYSKHRAQIRGFDIFVKGNQTFKNIVISNVTMDLGGATQGNPENALAAGFVIRGHVKDLHISNSTIEGFAGAGAFLGKAVDGDLSPENISFSNVVFKNNNGAFNSDHPEYAGWPTIVVRSDLKNLRVTNCRFQMDSNSVNTVLSVLPAWANGNVPFTTDSFYFENNQYKGYNLYKDVYDLQGTPNVFVNDRNFFSTRSEIPAHPLMNYYNGMKIEKYPITDSIIGWICRQTGTGAAAVWETLFSGNAGSATITSQNKGIFYVSENYSGAGGAVIGGLSNSAVTSSNSSYTSQLAGAKMGSINNPFPDPWTARNAALDSITAGSIGTATINIIKGNFTVGSDVFTNNGDSLGVAANNTVADIGFTSASGLTIAPLMRNNIFFYFEVNTSIHFINKTYPVNGGGDATDATHTKWISGIYGKGCFYQVYGNLELFYPNFFKINNSRAELYFEADKVVSQEFFVRATIYKTINVKIREFITHKRGALIMWSGNSTGESEGDGLPSSTIFEIENVYKGYKYFPYPSLNVIAGYTPLIGLDYSSAVRLKTHNFKFKNVFLHETALHVMLNAFATGGSRDVYNHIMTISIDYLQHDLNVEDQAVQTVAGALFQPISHGNGTSFIRDNVHSTISIKTAVVDHSLVSIRLIAPTHASSKNNSITINVDNVIRRYKIAPIAGSIGIENLFTIPYLMQTSSGLVIGEKTNVVFNIKNATAKFGNIFGTSGLSPAMLTGANTTIIGTYITEDGSPVMEVNGQGYTCTLKDAIFIAKGAATNSIIINNGGNPVNIYTKDFITNLPIGSGITQHGTSIIDANITNYH